MADVLGETGEAEQVRDLIAGLGLDALVDIHTHFMPQRVLDKVWAYFDAVGPKTGRAWPIQYRGSEADRLETLRAFGVRRFSSLNYPHKPGMAKWLNDWSTRFAAEHSDCLHSATFYPEPGAAEYVREALDAGARVFKVHIQVGEYDPNDPLLDPVWGSLADSGTPVVIHCGDGPTPGTYTGHERIERLMSRFPRLVLVIAHMGLPSYGAFLDLAERFPTMRLDTTMAFTDFTEQSAPFPPAELPRLADLGDRVLFGSDFPNIPYPYAHAIEAVVALGLGDEWNRAVLHDNGARLFALP